ncbi:rhomboid family intramembrane serine protease [Muriicola sp.]|uniref:rhomboid family intramembrane serine protease n=1 Tax=Muriicola sp. TaxID=2020856 RepID=UPI003C78BFCA
MSTGGLRYQYARLSIAEKLITINVAVFILNALLPFLLGFGRNAISQWFELPVDLMAYITQPWSIITYSFFHADLWHLFFNMLLLYFSARIFLNIFSARKLINVYFLGVILGGLFFVVSYNIFPVFLGANTSIIGASAGVTAVLIFICAYIPNQIVRVVFFNVKLWYLGAFFVLLDLVQIPANNSGGHLAHLGGALLGYVYARQLTKGKDIGEGFSKLLDALGAMFKPKEKKASMKTVYRKTTASAKSKVDYDKESRQRKIDSILDKISKSGYESLTKAEKDFLFKAGKEE